MQKNSAVGSTSASKYLHRELTELAEQQGASLNQLVVTLLARGVGSLRPQRRGDELVYQVARVNETRDERFDTPET